ncbi:MAG: hypothetical protein DIU68_017675 [Chloroflexota bacterium]
MHTGNLRSSSVLGVLVASVLLLLTWPVITAMAVTAIPVLVFVLGGMALLLNFIHL